MAKQIRGLYVHAPWASDPYDAVVSFTTFFVPLLCAVGVLRALHCRRGQAIQQHRVLDLIRAGRLILATIILTLAADWISVSLGERGSSWNDATGLLVGMLALATLLAARAAMDLRRASSRSLTMTPTRAPAPDVCADLVVLLERGCRLLGRFSGHGRRAVRWLDSRVVALIGRRPVLAAAVVAGTFGIGLALAGAITEGAGAILPLLFVVGACGMFAFIVAAGAYLDLVQIRSHSHGSRRHAIRAATAACASVPITLAFRDSIWSAIGLSASDISLLQLEKLLSVAAASTFVAVFLVQLLARNRNHQET